MSRGLRRLAVAVATGRVASVFLEDDKLVGWKMSRTAAKNTQNAARIAQGWVSGFQPDHMIVEDPNTAERKGEAAKVILQAIASIFADAPGLDLRLTRTQSFQNKYVEAKALAARYPEIAPLCPEQRPIWMPEPRNMSYFEALALVEQLKD